MRLVTATFVRNEAAPGWAILDESVPHGKEYVVDLDCVTTMTLKNLVTGQEKSVEVIWVESPGHGWLPLIALELKADA